MKARICQVPNGQTNRGGLWWKQMKARIYQVLNGQTNWVIVRDEQSTYTQVSQIMVLAMLVLF